MEGLSVMQCAQERCRPDKETVNTVTGYHRLHLVISGKGILDGKEIAAGETFLCRANRYHCYQPDPVEPWTYYWFNVSGGMADHLLEKAGFGIQNVLPYPMTPPLQILLDLGTQSRQPDYLCGIFIAVIGLLENNPILPAESITLQHIRTASALIQRTNGSITAAEIACQMNLSRAYIRNLFQQHTGFSLQAYIIRYRMQQAAQMLCETEYSIAQVASYVGYHDSFQFTKMFRKQYHCSPSVYRKTIRSAVGKMD